ncbi:LLM class flavin-dependent oxidoreductase [Pseudomonas cannabina]|uniref:Luciferase family protein n=1 Tax=Pseudomonas cannabina TaxID=86840 RepID=A0A0P9MTC9_PSECA|nr:LLM class flavin-dependent oxidoreductase [Pseudomonas cannabina]KAA8716029.1 LLM class flavin-dependent oxidoreductase [Pseudomonas cannabina]KPW73391.1 Luciferase family protein [Pseudomonas cannabina]RMN23747.1 Luciferase protein [Pseudomonas cannabina]SDQ81722.1 Flavin-dependent oxidoreductase, luciferase family (includes alkanesulfonate monooxygenase SsuD and methylene tetrahydromethanopterin reductase) [Pseudomonas cannabina]
MRSEKAYTIKPNPMRSSRNRLQLGVFSSNTEGGCTVTNAPERLRGDDWAGNLEIARIADDAGFEAFIPVGRWKGFGGTNNTGGISFETYTWTAGIAALTHRIAVFSTSHLPTVHPLFAAKQAATIDHISGGRFGLNILCGWYGAEMRMFSGQMMEHDQRYDYAEEWLQIAKNAWQQHTPFDFRGEYFNVCDAVSQPKPLNPPYLINAGGSPRGKRFCAEHCDAAFLIIKHLDGEAAVRQQIASYKDLARQEFDRDLKIWCYGYVVQKDTQEEADAYLDYYANELGDEEGCSIITRELGIQTGIFTPEDAVRFRFHFKAGFAGVPLVGTPERIVELFEKYAAWGIDGIALTWLDYHQGIKDFVAQTLPLMERAGLRESSDVGAVRSKVAAEVA